MNNLGLIADVRGDYDEATSFIMRVWQPNGKLMTDKAKLNLNNLGLIAENKGNYDEAERLHNASLAIKREIGNRLGELIL